MPSEAPQDVPPTDPGEELSQGPALEAVLDLYMEELAEGRHPDPEEYARRYPALANALRGVFRTLEFVEAAGTSLNAAALRENQQLGEFRIVREVGRGGMGVVYEAIQTTLNRRVALKVLPAGAMLADAAAERFSREAATAGRLHHTNIVPVYAVGCEQGIPYYAMQFIDGHSLAEHLHSLKRSGTHLGRSYLQRVARWGQQAAEALAYAHGEGTVHRDIKPSNLLLDARDNIWVTDFGLARADAAVTLTATGDIVGTARYLAPEQARGGVRPDARSDIYALGATLYELIAFTPPFDGDSRGEVLNQIVFGDPRPLSQLNRAVPHDLETIIAKCMEKIPARRYGSAAEVAEDCRRFLAGESIRARRTPVFVKLLRWGRRHRLHLAGAALAIVLAATSLFLLERVRLAEGRERLGQGLSAVLFEQDMRRGGALLDEAEALGVRSYEVPLYRAMIPIFNGQPPRALALLEQARQRAPQNAEVGYGLALAHYAAADFFNGSRIFELYETRGPDTALAWLLRGMALSRMQRSDAIESYNRAIELQSDFTPAIGARGYYRGNRLCTLGEREALDPMLNDFDALVTFRPNSARAYASRASGWLFSAAFARTQPDLRAQADRWLSNCRNDLERAELLRRAEDSLVHFRKGTYFLVVHDYARAAEATQVALAIDRAETGAPDFLKLNELCVSRHALGEFEPLLAEIQPHCAVTPGYYPLRLHEALLLAELGRLEAARAAARDALQRNALNANALVVSAAILELLGAEAQAQPFLEAFDQADLSQVASEDAAQSKPAAAPAFLLRRISETELLSAAANPGQLCEHWFLIALRRLGSGERAAGVEALRRCVATEVFIFGEYRYATAMLARAEADPHWPKWVGGAGGDEETERPRVEETE